MSHASDRHFASHLWRHRGLIAIALPVYVVSLVLCGHANESGPEGGYNQPTQPVPFSHAVHAAADLDCRYCHATVETSNHPRAAEAVCLKCHKSTAKDGRGFGLVRQAAAGGPPVPWVKVNSVPEWITFNHRAHVVRGVSCESCHGRVDQMETTFQAESLSMGWCMDCHTDPTLYLREQTEVTAMGFKPAGGARAYGQKIKNERGISADNGCVYCHRPNATAKTLDDLLAPSK